MAITRASFSIQEELRDQLAEVSKKENRSVSSMIQVFIKEGLDKRGIKGTKNTVMKKVLLKKQ
jgi:hypothetical protein